MASSEHEHHRIDYVEVSATDLDVAKRFYAAAFGWTFRDYGPAYVGFKDGASGREAFGIEKTDRVVSGGVLVLLYSEDLEATLAAVREAGGAVTKEIFAFPGGRRFQFTDPSGNELGVWSDRGDIGPM